MTYEATGSQTTFNIPFDYLRNSFVKAKIGDNGEPMEYEKDYTVANRQITFTVAPIGQLIIYRETPTDRLIQFFGGSVLKSDDMNVMNLQQLHIIEEQQDWTTKYMESTHIQYLEEMKALKDEATSQANKAETEADNSQNSSEASEDYSELAQKWAESADSPNGEPESKSAKTWAGVAEEYSTSMKQYKEDCENYANEATQAAEKAEALAAQASVYDPATAYEPGDIVMTAEGDTYRCIANSIGETPNSSNKWVLVTQVKYETFELDLNGDLQPLYVPNTSTNFQIDENGDIMPIED